MTREEAKGYMWVVSYVDDMGIPTVTVFDNEIAANQCYMYFLSEGHKKVEIDHAPIYQNFLWDDQREANNE